MLKGQVVFSPQSVIHSTLKTIATRNGILTIMLGQLNSKNLQQTKNHKLIPDVMKAYQSHSTSNLEQVILNSIQTLQHGNG